MSGPPDTKIDWSRGPVSMLPDGTVLQFPKGTSQEVMDKAYQRELAASQQQQGSAQPSAPNVGTGEAFGIGATQGVTANFGDEIASGIAATVGYPPGRPGYPAGDTWSERYGSALKEARGVQSAAQQQHPVAYGAGEVSGAVAPALLAPEMYGSRAIAEAPTAVSAAGRAAAFGAGQGAVAGFGGGEGGAENRLRSAAVGGAAGAVTGAVTAPIARGVGNLVGRGPNPTIPTNDQIQTAGDALYQAADNAGVIITPQAIQGLENTIRQDLGGSGFDATLHPQIMAAYRRIVQQAQSGQPITLRGLDILRQVAGDAADSPRRGERRLGSMLIQHIDDFIDGLNPNDLVMGNAGQAVPALQNARQVWSSLRKSELVDELVHTAELQAASTNSGGNLQNVIRQKLRTLLTNRSLGRGFTDEERQALEQIVRGTPTQNGLRILGRLAPSSNSWLGVISTLAGGPAGALVPVIGATAKGAANRSTENAVLGLSELVRGGSGLRVQGPPLPGPSFADALLAGGRAGTNQAAQMYANQLLRQPNAP